MSNRLIGGPLDLVALAAPLGVCRNCYLTYRATVPRPAFCWCHHSRTAARERKDGTWTILENVTPSELKALQAGEVPP